MPLELQEGLRSDLVVCGLSGKRYSGVSELHEMLKPLVIQGRVALVPKDGLCSPEALNRYVRWARAAFFIRVEADAEVRAARGWRAQFGPEDHVRDEHWTETGLDGWDGWDAVVYHDGDEDALLAKAKELAPRINALVDYPDRCKHRPIPENLVTKTEHTTPMPDCMIPGWGVNPPQKNERGEYEIRDVGRPATGMAPPKAKQGPREAPPPNPLLQAAAERAAMAAQRWDERSRAGHEGIVTGAELPARPAPGATPARTQASASQGVASNLVEAVAGAAAAAAEAPAEQPAGGTYSWGGWGSWGAGSGSWNQDASATWRGAWGERPSDAGRAAAQMVAVGGAGAREEMPTAARVDGDSDGATAAGAWGGHWSSSSGAWGRSWGEWSSPS